MPLHYRLRIRTADDTADDLVVTSIPDGVNPYIDEAGIPQGDGQTLNPVTGEVVTGAMSVGVIDALAQFAAWTPVHVVDFGAFADTAALLAAWPEIDPDGIGTWTLVAPTLPLFSARVPQVSVSGSHVAGQSTRIRGTFGGFTPGTSVRARWGQYENRSSVNGPASTWNTVTDHSYQADAAGQVALDFVYAIQTSGLVSPNPNTIQFDALVLEELTTGEDRLVTSRLADAQGRQQYLSRRGYIDSTEDLGASFDVLMPGYVTVCELTTAMRYTISVGESRRVEASVRVFEKAEPGFDRVSCIVGGPIIGDFGPLNDIGRPRFQVVDTSSTPGIVFLKWTGGRLYRAAGVTMIHPPIPDELLGFLNAFADPYLGDFDNGVGQPFPDLVARLMAIDTAPGLTSNPPAGLTTDTQDFVPVSVYGGGLNLPGQNNAYNLLGGNDITVGLRWPAGVTLPAVGAPFKLVIFPRFISESNALHWRGHPMDLVTGLFALRGIPYDAPSAAAVRTALGDSLQIELRITGGMSLTDACAKLVYGPFGVGPRTNAAGALEFFTTRHRQSDLPAGTITLDDLVDMTPPVWRIEESSAVNKVTFRAQAFTTVSSSGAETGPNVPIDYLRAIARPFNVTPDPSDYEVYGDRSVTYELPGGLLGGDMAQFVATLAADLFEERGRGAIVSQLPVRRGAAAAEAKIGEEVILNLPHLPTANPTQTPVSQRGTTPRIALVVRRTPTPSGPLFTVNDRGIALQAGLVPTFTIVPSAGEPRKVATVAITNGPALAAAGVTVRIEWAVSGSSPATGQLLRTLDPATDALTFDLPVVDAGARVWARMRTEQAGTRPGSWSAFEDADLDDLDAPTSLAGTVSGAYVDLTWVLGANAGDIPLEILLRETSAPDFEHVTSLPVGSTQYRLGLPTASTNYTIGVRHREAPPFAGVSPTATLALASDVVEGLSAPIDPAVFSDGQGTFGLEVTATVIPSGTEFWVAVETAVGSGIPDTSSAVQTLPSVAGGRTRFTNPTIAANDGKRRYLKARHTLDAAVSDFTLELPVSPWTVTLPTDPPPPPGDGSDPGLDSGAPLSSHIYFHAAHPVGMEFTVTSARTEIAGSKRLLKDTTGYGEVRGELQFNGTDPSGPAGSFLVFECRPRGSTDVADFRPLGVAAGPVVALDGTPGAAACSDGWVQLAPEAIGDMEVRVLTEQGDDVTPVALEICGLEFRRGPPQDPTGSSDTTETGLLADFWGDRGKLFDAGSAETSPFDFGAYANFAAMLADGWVESDPSNIAGWSLATPPVVLNSAKVPKLLWSGTVPAGYDTSLAKPFGGFTPGATLRVRWFQYQDIASVNGPANTWNPTSPRDLIADGGGHVSPTFLWHEILTANQNGHFMLFDGLTFEEQGAGLDTWRDQSGNGNDATYVAGARGADGGTTVILIGGAVLHLPAGMLDGFPAVEIYAAVAAAADPGGTNKTIWTLGGAASLYPDGSGVLQEAAGRAAAAGAGNPTTTLAALRLYHVRPTEAGVTVMLDGAQQAALGPGALVWNADLTIGGGVTFSRLKFYGLQVPHTNAERDRIYAAMLAQLPTLPVDPPIAEQPDPGTPVTPLAGTKSLYLWNLPTDQIASYPPFNGSVSVTTAANLATKIGQVQAVNSRLLPTLVSRADSKRNGVYDFNTWLAELLLYAGSPAAAFRSAYDLGDIPGPCVIDEPQLATAGGWGIIVPWSTVDEMCRREKLVIAQNIRTYIRSSTLIVERSGYRFTYLDGCICQHEPISASTINRRPTVEAYIRDCSAAGLRIAKRIVWGWNLENSGTGESGIRGASGGWYTSAREIRAIGIPFARAIANGNGDGLAVWASRIHHDYLLRSDIRAAFEDVQAAMP